MDGATFVVTKWWAALIAGAAVVAVLTIAHVLISGTQARRDGHPKSLTRRRQRGVKALVIGFDGRASTSKLQVLLWTLAVLYAFAFLLVWGRSLGCGNEGDDNEDCVAAASARGAFGRVLEEPLETEYYALLGLPTAAAVAAKTLTQGKVARGELAKRSVDETGEKRGGVGQAIAEVVSTDDGRTDLIDFQYFAFNLVSLSYFTIEFISRPARGLPELPPTLIALSGVAVAAYTGKKALEKNPVPAITTVIPRRVILSPRTTLTVVGTGFGRPGDGGDERLLVDGFTVDTTSWTDHKIEARLDADVVESLRDLDSRSTADVTVIDGDGAMSAGFTIELHRPPEPR
ncbi:MAG: IPT/TIG domain-containing protein [Actinomycetota bacterium]|nr:IPT/TIG domain-containing protein [Actinomycetota bacterium]